jgi:putative oxidoreductase
MQSVAVEKSMGIFQSASDQWTARMLSVLRVFVALLFIQHGMQKLVGYPPPAMPMPPFHLFSQLGAAAVLEVFGGLLLLIGLFTRPIAFLLSGEMAVAYFQVHAPRGFWPVLNQGEPAAMFCFVFLYFAFASGGAWSIDALIARPQLTARTGNSPGRVGDHSMAAD